MLGDAGLRDRRDRVPHLWLHRRREHCPGARDECEDGGGSDIPNNSGFTSRGKGKSPLALVRSFQGMCLSDGQASTCVVHERTTASPGGPPPIAQ